MKKQPTPPTPPNMDIRLTAAMVLIQDRLPDWIVEIWEYTSASNSCDIHIHQKGIHYFSMSWIDEILEGTPCQIAPICSVNLPAFLSQHQPTEPYTWINLALLIRE